MQIDHAPNEGTTAGWVRCRVCGQHWDTTPEQDDLLAELFAHDAGHDAEAVGIRRNP